MKRLMMMTVALMATVGTMYAQPGPDSPAMREKTERLKIAFLTERLDLSVEESQQFWPVYNEFQNDRKEIKKRIKRAMQGLEDSSRNESDVQKTIDDVHTAKRDMITLEENYLEDVLQVLGPKKTIALIDAEEDFKKEIIRRIRKEQEENRGERPGMRRK